MVETLLKADHFRLQALSSRKKYLSARNKGLMHGAMMAIGSCRRAYRAFWNEFKELGSAIFPAGCLKMRTRFHAGMGFGNDLFDVVLSTFLPKLMP